MKQRPNLNVEIAGYADYDLDKEGLIKLNTASMLKKEKLKARLRSGKPGLPLSQIEVTQREVKQKLTELDSSRKSSRDKISDGDLRNLAQKRAENIKKHLLIFEKFAAKRLSIAEPLVKKKANKDENSWNKSRIKIHLNQ